VKPTGPLILAAIVGVEVVARSGLVALLDLPALLDLLALLESWCSSITHSQPCRDATAVPAWLCRRILRHQVLLTRPHVDSTQRWVSTPAVSPAVMPRLCRLSFSPSAVDRNDHSEQPRDCSGPAASTTGGERTLCIGTQTLGTQTPRLEAWPVFPVVRSRARVVTRVVTLLLLPRDDRAVCSRRRAGKKRARDRLQRAQTPRG
jgi:hypothetical protein